MVWEWVEIHRAYQKTDVSLGKVIEEVERELERSRLNIGLREVVESASIRDKASLYCSASSRLYKRSVSS
jgi:hypothetical protein